MILSIGESMGIESAKKIGVRTVLILTAIVLFQGIALTLSSPSLDNRTVAAGQEVNFTVEAQPDKDLELQLAPPKSSVKSFSMNESNGTYWKNISGSLFSQKGRYGYRFADDSQRFPSGEFFGLTVSSLNETIKNKTLNASDTQHENTNSGEYCAYKTEGDFSCEFENFQAYMILSSAVHYSLEDTNYTKEKFYNFTTGNYAESLAYPTCDLSDGYDYINCENKTGSQNPLDIQSGTRQGSLIYALWESYDLVGNESVKRLAKNYTRGSAESCDVWGAEWNKSFECGKARGQGSMALGYWTAYEKTGNETYREFARKLSTTDYSNPRIISALLEGYKFTSNESYLEEAENRTKYWLEECPNCSSQEFMDLKNALWRGYRVTGEFGYYRNAVNLTGYNSSEFCSWNSSSCTYPNLQGLSTLSYWRAYSGQKDGVEKKLFHPEIGPETVVGENLSVEVGMQGKISEPNFLYRERGSNSSWGECSVDFFDGCEVRGENITKQAPYSFRFRMQDNSTFPVNGSFVFAPSLRKDTFIDEAERFTTSDPDRFCQPFSGDFTCEGDFIQSKMISGFSTFANFNRSYYRLGELVTPPYFSDSRYEVNVRCEARNKFIGCNSGSGPGSESFKGSSRQGSMIESFFSSYTATGNSSYYETALNYSLGGAEDCDVWGRRSTKSFECGSSEGQAAMIEGYLEAYRVTGNSTFREIALNLTEEAENVSSSRDLGTSLWRSSSLFNQTVLNYSLTGEAQNITEGYIGHCVGNCSPGKYVDTAEMFESSYLYSGGNYSTQYRDSVLNTTQDDSCGPFKLDRTCNSPRDQGGMMELFWEAAYTMPVELKVQDSFNLSSSTVKVGQQVQATCMVENRLQDTNITGLSFEISTSEGLSVVSNNTTYQAGTLQFNNSSSFTRNISADSTVSGNVSCTTDSDTAYRNTFLKDLTVEEKQQEEEGQDDSDDSSSSGGGGGGSISSPALGGLLDEGPENVSFSYNNTSTEVGWNRTLLEELGINTTFRNFSYRRSCFSASRGLYQNTSELNVSYSCESDEVVVLDAVPENLSLENGSKVQGYGLRHLENISDRRINLKYSERGNKTDFQAPLVLSGDYEVPPLDVDFNWSSNLTRENETLEVVADLSRESRCTISRNGTVVFSEKTKQLREEVRLMEGNNSINFSCGKSFSDTKEVGVKPSEDIRGPDLPLALFFLSFLGISLAASTVYYRGEIYSRAEQALFDFYMGRFETAMEENDQPKAIKIYSRISGIRDEEVGKMLLESDLNLMRGLRIYLILDLLEDDEVANSSIPIGEDIENLIERFMEDTDDEKLKRMIREKMQEVSQLAS
jgi:hypothetical protein